MKKQLTDLQKAFSVFMATPSRGRASQKDWGEKHGISEQSLSTWKNLPAFNEAVEEARGGILVPDAIDVLTQMLRSTSDKVKLDAAQSILKKWNPYMGEGDIVHTIKELYEKYHPKE